MNVERKRGERERERERGRARARARIGCNSKWMQCTEGRNGSVKYSN